MDALGCLALWLLLAFILFAYALVGGKEDEHDNEHAGDAGRSGDDPAGPDRRARCGGRQEGVVSDGP